MRGIMGPDRPVTTFVSRSLFEWLYAMGVCLGNLALLHAAVYHGLTNNMAVMPSLDALAHDPDLASERGYTRKVVSRLGFEPRTRGLKVPCSDP